MEDYEELETPPRRTYRTHEQAKIEAKFVSNGQWVERTKHRISRSRLVRNIAAATFCLSAVGYGATLAVDKDTPFDEVAIITGFLSFHVGVDAEDKRRKGIDIVNGVSQSAIKLADRYNLDIPEWVVLPEKGPLPPTEDGA